MTLQIGNIEYEIDNFHLTVGKVDSDGKPTFEGRKRIFVTIPKGIDKNIDQLNQEISSNFNNVLIFNTRFGQLVYENFDFEELSLDIADSLFDLAAVFIEKIDE